MIEGILKMYHTPSTQDKHHRFKSWEHCYNFFRKNYQKLDQDNIFDQACLHLAFYLASWGMLRGSTFLLQKDYRVHEYFINEVVRNKNFEKFFQTNQLDSTGMDELISATREAYTKNVQGINGYRKVNVSDTLASKIILGVFGNVPAYDRYLVEALGVFGIKKTLNENSLNELVSFYKTYEHEFEECRRDFSHDNVYYSPMKLMDMFFWQVGYMLNNIQDHKDELDQVINLAEYYKKEHEPKQPVQDKKVKGEGLTQEIRDYILDQLTQAKRKGASTLDIRAGDVHKEMGLKDRVPPVCNAMDSIDIYDFDVIHTTPSGKSTTKENRYYLTSNK